MYRAEESASLTGSGSSKKRTTCLLSGSWSVCGNFPEPPKIISTLVPEVRADRRDDATESAAPRVVIDLAMSGRQETGALGTDEFALSGIHAHAAVHPIFLSKL